MDDSTAPITETTEEVTTVPEFVFDLNTADKPQHVWVDRGLVQSCETASHPHHQAWKRRPMQQ